VQHQAQVGRIEREVFSDQPKRKKSLRTFTKRREKKGDGRSSSVPSGAKTQRGKRMASTAKGRGQPRPRPGREERKCMSQ